jgi:hypothetical protein
MSAKFWGWFHLANVAVWAVMIPVTLATGLKHSVPFLVFISLLALVYSELSSWQASRVERRADPDDSYGEETEDVVELDPTVWLP